MMYKKSLKDIFAIDLFYPRLSYPVITMPPNVTNNLSGY